MDVAIVQTFSKNLFASMHVIGMALRLTFCKPPAPAKDVSVGEKRKRGRPRKITKALLIE